MAWTMPCVWHCVSDPWTRGKLTRIPGNCFSSILQDLDAEDPLPLCCPCCFLSLFTIVSPLSAVFRSFRRCWCSPHPVVLQSSSASSLLFGSVVGVASPLCVNSALIQELFYAVKRTCDKQKGVEGGVGVGVGWGVRQQFSLFVPFGHIQNDSTVFEHDQHPGKIPFPPENRQ